MRSKHFIIAVLITLTLLCASVPVLGVGELWTTVGSDGTPDDSNRNAVIFTGTVAEVSQGFIGTVRMRYNVDQTTLDGQPVELKVRYRDNGARARVIVRLKEHNFTTGDVTDVVSFDSDDEVASADFQIGSALSCTLTESHLLDFSQNAYYIEIELRKTGSRGDPGVSQIRLIGIVC